MYFLYKEHKNPAKYYVSKKPYAKKLTEREGFCKQCYNCMLKIRKEKNEWRNYSIPFHDVLISSQPETDTGVNNIESAMRSNIQSFIKDFSISVENIDKTKLDKTLKDGGKYYITFSIS